MGELLLLALTRAHVNGVLVERVARLMQLLLFEVIVLVVLGVKVILRPAVKGACVAVVRDDSAVVVLGYACCPDAMSDFQLSLQHLAGWATLLLLLLMVLLRALHSGMHFLVGHRHTQPASSGSIVTPVILGLVRHLFQGVLDYSLHGHGVDHEAEVDVALHACGPVRVHPSVPSIILVVRLKSHLMIWASMLRLCDESIRLSSLLSVLLWIVLAEFLRALLLDLRHLVLWLVAARPTPQHVFQLWLLLLQLLEVLLHLLLVLQGLESGHLVRIWKLALRRLLRLQHHLLLLPHVVRLHLLLPDYDAFVVVDARHVHYLGLEFR